MIIKKTLLQAGDQALHINFVGLQGIVTVHPKILRLKLNFKFQLNFYHEFTDINKNIWISDFEFQFSYEE